MSSRRWTLSKLLKADVSKHKENITSLKRGMGLFNALHSSKFPLHNQTIN
jgi:hypothetical protein